MSSQYYCPIIGGTGLEILLNYYQIQHQRIRSDNDIDFLDLNPTQTKKLIAHLKKMGFKLYNGDNVADAMVTYQKANITVDILLDRNGFSGNHEIYKNHTVTIDDILLINECGMLFSKLTRIIDLQAGITATSDFYNPALSDFYNPKANCWGFAIPVPISPAAQKIQHDMQDIKLLNLIKAAKKSHPEIRQLIEENVTKIYKEDENGEEVEISQTKYFSLIK